jgi:hypothetical protein
MTAGPLQLVRRRNAATMSARVPEIAAALSVGARAVSRMDIAWT